MSKYLKKYQLFVESSEQKKNSYNCIAQEK